MVSELVGLVTFDLLTLKLVRVIACGGQPSCLPELISMVTLTVDLLTSKYIHELLV